MHAESQAYDFLELYRREGVAPVGAGPTSGGRACRAPAGRVRRRRGRYCHTGVELTRRVEQGKVIGLTAPLLQTADGRKMGKTAAGAVWLSPDKLSPFDYWQF